MEKDTIWTFEQEHSLALTNVVTNIRMTVVKLKTNELWVHAPIAPTEYAPHPFLSYPVFSLDACDFVFEMIYNHKDKEGATVNLLVQLTFAGSKLYTEKVFLLCCISNCLWLQYSQFCFPLNAYRFCFWVDKFDITTVKQPSPMWVLSLWGHMCWLSGVFLGNPLSWFVGSVCAL